MKKDPELLKILDLTPYLLPDGCDIQAEVLRLHGEQAALSRRLTIVIDNLRSANLFRENRSFSRNREIYESNAIEGVGPNFKVTSSLLNSSIADDAAQAIRKGMLLSTLSSDQQVLDVLGLHGAKLLSEEVSKRASNGRPLTEVDIRTFHSIVCNGAPDAGSYRQTEVTIYKADHRPPEWFKVGGMMRDLMAWLNSTGDATPVILRSAVLHAWFTHIHPFSDGNGRVARLLVNLLVARAGLPPVIVRHQADRARYIDALALSDQAGDVLPFAGTFLETQKRHMREFEKPQFLRQIFHDEIRQRGDTLYDHWRNLFVDFIDRLTVELKFYKLRVERVGDIDRTSFKLLRGGDSTGNVWFLIIRDQRDREILVWLGYSSTETATSFSQSGKLPAMYFSVRNNDERLAPYRKLSRYHGMPFSEAILVPDVPANVIIAYDKVKRGSVVDATRLLSEGIFFAFTSGVIPD